MPTFAYVAKRGPHEVVEGQIDADSQESAFSKLGTMGYVPVKIWEPVRRRKAASAEGPPAPSTRVSARTLLTFTHQLTSLIKSAVPVVRALRIVQEQTSDPRMQAVAKSISRDLQQGQPLSEAFRRYPGIFSPIYVNMVRCGEVSGALPTVLARLATYLEHEAMLRARAQTALVYPAFIAASGALTVTVLLAVVVPRLLSLFADAGTALPWPTRLLVACSAALSRNWPYLLGITVLLLAWARVHPVTPRERRRWDRWSLRVPGLSTFLYHADVGRFALALGMLFEHGVPIFQAVEVAVPTMGNGELQRAFGRIPQALKDGQSLAASLQAIPSATPFLINLVAVGEESGRLQESLSEIARVYERETERLAQLATSLLEPCLILLIGVVVGFIVLALLLPIFEMNALVR